MEIPKMQWQYIGDTPPVPDPNPLEMAHIMTHVRLLSRIHEIILNAPWKLVVNGDGGGMVSSTDGRRAVELKKGSRLTRACAL